MKTILFRSLFVTALLAGSASMASAQNLGSPQQGPVVNTDRFAPEEISHVRMLLSGYHGLPDRDVLLAAPHAFEIVSALSQSGALLVRDRALEALGRFWPSGDVYLTYANVLADPGTPEGTRHRIMLVSAEVFGERAIPMIRPYLDVDDVQLRLTAIDALGRIRTDEAVAILTEQTNSEAHPLVLQRLDKASRVLR